MNRPMRRNSQKFPVHLECGVLCYVELEVKPGISGPVVFEYAKMRRGTNEAGEHELVIHCRIACMHPEHEVKP